jgi:segregation and condensation protein B
MSDASPELQRIVESLVFVSDEPVPIEAIARAVEQEVATIEQIVDALAAEYQTRGFRLARTRDRVQLVSAPEAAPYIQKFLGLEASARLSPAALETLAIIAYRQPITRPQIEAVRGVNSDGVIHTLLTRGLIEEMGHLETVGHPIQYGTSFEFLQYFGLSRVSDLPPLPPDTILDGGQQDVGELLRGKVSTETER